jgi:hypothetical protein
MTTSGPAPGRARMDSLDAEENDRKPAAKPTLNAETLSQGIFDLLHAKSDTESEISDDDCKPAALTSPKQPDNLSGDAKTEDTAEESDTESEVTNDHPNQLHILFKQETNTKPGEYLHVPGNKPLLVMHMPNPGVCEREMDRPFTNNVFSIPAGLEYERASDGLRLVDSFLFKIRCVLYDYVHTCNKNISQNKFYDLTDSKKDSDDKGDTNV